MADTWTRLPDLGKVFEEYLKTKYIAYRAALADPTVIPADTDIEWGTWYSGAMAHTFRGWEEYIDPVQRFLGGNRRDRAAVSTWFITRWTASDRPPYVVEWRHFLNQTLAMAANPTDSLLTAQGIHGLEVARFRITQGPEEARSLSTVTLEQAGVMEDFWVLHCSIAVALFERRL